MNPTRWNRRAKRRAQESRVQEFRAAAKSLRIEAIHEANKRSDEQARIFAALSDIQDDLRAAHDLLVDLATQPGLALSVQACLRSASETVAGLRVDLGGS